MCRSENFNSYINKQVDRKVKNLLVYCNKKEEGCQWKGELNDVNDHAHNSCQFQKVYCPNECGELIQRQNILFHTDYECMHRLIECRHCQYRGKFCYIIFQHLEDCPKFPLPCPNHCNSSITILRESLNAHEKVCPLAKVKCRYYELGCNTIIARRDLKWHNKSNAQYHLNLVMYDRHCLKSRLTKVTEELEEIKDKFESVSNKLENTQRSHEQQLLRQKESTKRAQNNKFQKRIDIIEGAIGEMTSDIESKIRTLEIVSLIFGFITALTLIFLGSKTVFLLYVAFCMLFICVKAYYMHNKFCNLLPFSQRLFCLWKIILLPHYKQTLVKTIQKARHQNTFYY